MRVGKSHRSDNLRTFSDNYVRLQDSVHAFVYMNSRPGTCREILPLMIYFLLCINIMAKTLRKQLGNDSSCFLLLTTSVKYSAVI